MFDLERLGCQDVLWEGNKQHVTESPVLVRAQMFHLGVGETKTAFDIIMTLDSFKPGRSNI